MNFDWVAAARAVGRFNPFMIGSTQAREFLERSPVAQESPWVLGCSGGSDSMMLVLWCWSRYAERRPQMRVAHLNHAQRGEESDADAQLVEKMAHGLGLPCTVGTLGSGMHGASEARLREARYRFFFDLLPVGGVVLLGHHLDDVLETQLMRLGRGASAAGLGAPRPVREAEAGRFVVRPFLNLDKRTLQNVLARQSVPFREDASNRDPAHTRNRMRNEVIPSWIEACPGNYLAGVLHTRQWMQEDDEALHQWAAHLLTEAKDGSGGLALTVFRGLPRAVGRRLFLSWMTQSIGSNPFAQSGLDQMMQLIEVCAGDSSRMEERSAGEHHFLVIGGGRLRLVWAAAEPDRIEPELLVPGIPRFLPPNQELLAEQVALGVEERTAILDGAISADRECILDYTSLLEAGLMDGPWIRSWEAGDRYHPLGSPGSRKLQDCFVDRGIPVSERKRRPVVCLTAVGEILWCPGLLPADDFKVSESTETALRLTYRVTSSA